MIERPGYPSWEQHRIAALHRYDILDTPPDGAFDRITALAADLFDVPISIVSLVDQDRIWFKSRHGVDTVQIDREPGLCASAILQGEPWVLTDARRDVRSLTNPLVAGEFGLQFYVGVPLRTSDGFNLGTLCVIDREPRAITDRQLTQLRNLASMVMDQMELRLSARNSIDELSRAVAEKETALRRAEVLAKEVDHRVMNSLQLVAALLRVQSRAVDDAHSAEQLKRAAGRVIAVARVHQHIYLNNQGDVGECRDYLMRLGHDLAGMLGTGEHARIVVDSIEARIAIDRLVPLGIIMNELVTNASKQGAMTIRVSLRHPDPDRYLLRVTDDGPGLPDHFDSAATEGLGMKVVGTLSNNWAANWYWTTPTIWAAPAWAYSFPSARRTRRSFPRAGAASA